MNSRMKTLVGAGLLCAALPALASDPKAVAPLNLDLPIPQVNIEVKLYAPTSNDLKDIGIDWGFGLGVSARTGIPGAGGTQALYGLEWTQSLGGGDRFQTYGGGVGLAIDLINRRSVTTTVVTPPKLILMGGLYESRLSGGGNVWKKSGFGFDAGLEFSVPGFSSVPVIQALFSKRPSAGGIKHERVLIVMVIPTIIR